MHVLVCIQSFNARLEADIAKNFLKAHKIEAVIIADDAGRQYHQIFGAKGAQLLVKEVDAEKASNLLKTAKK